MLKYFVYGSLRKGEYNHQLIQKKAKFVSYGVLREHTMVSFMFYPAIYWSGKGDIVGEIYEIEDKHTINQIHKMEIDSGYYLKTVMVGGEDKPHLCFVYAMDKAKCIMKQRVCGGDWSKHNEETFI